MADAKTLASHLGVSLNRISRTPERVNHPKDEMVNLGRRSRRRDVREDMAPREESRRRVGPAYASRLIEYVKNKWRPEVASKRSETTTCSPSNAPTISFLAIDSMTSRSAGVMRPPAIDASMVTGSNQNPSPMTRSCDRSARNETDTAPATTKHPTTAAWRDGRHMTR